MRKKEITREYIQHHKEDILILIQHLADVVRFADRKPDAPNADFYKDYFEMARSIWDNIFL